MDNVFRLCNKAGFDVKCLEADSEFKPLLEPLQDELDIDMTFAAEMAYVDDTTSEPVENGRVFQCSSHLQL